jgi:hypothetical protein
MKRWLAGSTLGLLLVVTPFVTAGQVRSSMVVTTTPRKTEVPT